ncbi:hypothetical protein AT727_02570 [Desulfitobacterium hafniense]|uniref:Transmembrane protein n=2 Tax=Desulfitobacterium hafniense TaxID=49338 RepID=A0A0W1JQS8_DESHA|nr:hypothetical protein AT727_02570 [Desulfitobacterium hafniense]
MATILLLSIVPLIIISLYSHPSADDFSFGLKTAQAWEENGTLNAVFEAAYKNTKEFYFNWQGTYSGSFILSLQPGIFGEGYYPIGSILLIIFFVTGNLFLFKVLFMDYLYADKWHYLIIASTVILLSLQFMYDPVEGFYWLSGGIPYTGFYALGLFLFGLILSLLHTKKNYIRIGLTLLSAILVATIAGGNYPTALVTAIILFFMMVYLGIKKDKMAFVIGFLTLIAVAGLLISVAAPGNSMRQASVSYSPSALKAILFSFAYGGYSIANSINLPVLTAFIFLTPFLYGLAKQSPFQFRYPLFVLIWSFCVYSALATPPLYAMGVNLPERLINIIYYSFFLFATGNLLYFLGWLARRLEHPQNAAWNDAVVLIKNSMQKNNILIFILISFLFICACIGRIEVGKGINGNLEMTNLPSSVEAAISLASGEAKTFDAENRKRIETYFDNTLDILEVPSYTAKPYLLYYDDITQNPEDWRNQAVANYYDKISVRLSE